MAKHAQDRKSRKKTSEELRRAENLKEYEKLLPKAIQHIRESQEAVLPCSFCDKDGNATKKDRDGKCIKCHGTFLVPDVARREWAAKEIGIRAAPPPKPVEMTIEDKSELDEFEREIMDAPDSEVARLFSSLNLRTSNTDGTDGSRPGS